MFATVIPLSARSNRNAITHTSVRTYRALDYFLPPSDVRRTAAAQFRVRPRIEVAAAMSTNFIQSTRKIVGAGVNYREILRATNAPKPDHPIIFFKPTSTLVLPTADGADNTVRVPEVFRAGINYEAELGVIVGKRCRNVTPEQAMGYVGGYCLALDMTGMDFILDARPKGLPWCLGKGFDTSTPVSRFVAPAELGDPNNVRVWCTVNGQRRQDDTTQNLIFSIAELIAYCSRYMTLEADDLILTGTPAGAGPVRDGDVIECGLGEIVKMRFQVKNE